MQQLIAALALIALTVPALAQGPDIETLRAGAAACVDSIPHRTAPYCVRPNVPRGCNYDPILPQTYTIAGCDGADGVVARYRAATERPTVPRKAAGHCQKQAVANARGDSATSIKEGKLCVY